MKGLGWIVAGIIAVWFLFFRRAASGAVAAASAPGNTSTSGGIDTGGTASPGASVIPLGTVRAMGLFQPGPALYDGPIYAAKSTSALVTPVPPRAIITVEVPSVQTIRPYYLPPATPYRSIA